MRVNLTTGQANGAGSDELFGIEDITGSRFNDRLTGDASSNFFFAGDGNDLLLGGEGDDSYVGEAGTER